MCTIFNQQGKAKVQNINTVESKQKSNTKEFAKASLQTLHDYFCKQSYMNLINVHVPPLSHALSRVNKLYYILFYYI